MYVSGDAQYFGEGADTPLDDSRCDLFFFCVTFISFLPPIKKERRGRCEETRGKMPPPPDTAINASFSNAFSAAFEGVTTLSPRCLLSPFPFPTPTPSPFPTPFPSPLPSPLPSPRPSPSPRRLSRSVDGERGKGKDTSHECVTVERGTHPRRRYGAWPRHVVVACGLGALRRCGWGPQTKRKEKERTRDVELERLRDLPRSGTRGKTLDTKTRQGGQNTRV